MPDNIVQKVLREHLISGELRAGEPISYRIDQVLLQDATGTMAWMEFEQLEVDRVQVSATHAGHSRVAYITKSGREVRAE